MNRKHIKRLIDALEAGPVKRKGKDIGFNMAEWCGKGQDDKTGHNCGTTACIAGYANILARKSASNSDAARAWLGLDQDIAGDLFVPTGFPLGRISLPQAIITLKNLLATGKVDWSHVK